MNDYENAISFIRGFYESEGCSTSGRGWLQIRIFNTKWENIHLVKKALDTIGFRYSVHAYSGGSGKNPSIVVAILGGSSEAKRFLKIVKPIIKNTFAKVR
ncbi:MAG: LAGLIDADG family homing endonuclease [archaeon]|nr:LAGLIDADG family homing endonuclease [archaeon]